MHIFITVWGWVNHGTNVAEQRVNEKEVKIIVSRSHAGEVKNVALDAFGKDAQVIPAGGAGSH